jgi:hypothetical protein
MESLQQGCWQTGWRPVTFETLLSVPPFVAGMVRDLTEGKDAPEWDVRTLPYDWENLDDLPIPENGLWEIATPGWLRCSSDGSFSLSPRPLGRRVSPGRVYAWLVQRDAGSSRRVTVWRIVWDPAGEGLSAAAAPLPVGGEDEVAALRARLRGLLAACVEERALSEEERQVLLARFALVDGAWCSLGDAAVYIGISGQEARAEQSRALLKLREKGEFVDALRAYFALVSPPPRLRRSLTRLSGELGLSAPGR